jgi:colanic acid/amylovoran biosynthesis protein
MEAGPAHGGFLCLPAYLTGCLLLSLHRALPTKPGEINGLNSTEVMTEILVTNAYSARNRGDGAIILGMVESLRRTEAFRTADIKISTTDFPADGTRYPVPVVQSFHSLKNLFSSTPDLNCLYFLLVLLPASLFWALARRLGGVDLPVGRHLRDLLRAYDSADLVVAAGGCYLYTTSAVRGNVVLLINIYSFFFGVLLGKPVYLYAQSIGPFADIFQAWMVRNALSRVRLVEYREEVSGQLLDGWHLPVPTHAVADAAFLLPSREPKGILDAGSDDRGPTVGMTVRKWFRDQEDQKRYERTMAAFVDWLADERRSRTVFLPQVTFTEGNDDDRVAARDVVSLVVHQDSARIIGDELSPEEIKWLCGRVEFFVGTRMHSNIFALSLGIPTLAISYQHKTEGIMADLGLAEFVVPITDISLNHLKDAFNRLVSRRTDVSEHLSRVIPDTERKAELGGRLIAEDFVILEDRAKPSGQAPTPRSSLREGS